MEYVITEKTELVDETTLTLISNGVELAQLEYLKLTWELDNKEHEHYYLNDHIKFIDEVIELKYIKAFVPFEGYGKQIIFHMMELAKKNKVNYLYLVSCPFYTKNLDLYDLRDWYESLGFKVVKDYGNAYGMLIKL